MARCGLGRFLVAFAQCLSFCEAHTCYVSQEPVPGPYPGIDGRYRWVLHGAGDGTTAPVDPCDCTAFRLGGVDTAPSGRGCAARPFNVTHLGQTPPEIHRALGCQQCQTQLSGSFSTGPDADGNLAPALFPFCPFADRLQTTFWLQMPDHGGARLHLAAYADETHQSPPYIIMWESNGVAIAKWIPDAGAYNKLTAFSRLSTGYPFTVSYDYALGQNGNAPIVTITVLGTRQVGEEEVEGEADEEYAWNTMQVQASDEQGHVVHYVGLSSTAQALWTFYMPE